MRGESALCQSWACQGMAAAGPRPLPGKQALMKDSALQHICVRFNPGASCSFTDLESLFDVGFSHVKPVPCFVNRGLYCLLLNHRRWSALLPWSLKCCLKRADAMKSFRLLFTNQTKKNLYLHMLTTSFLYPQPRQSPASFILGICSSCGDKSGWSNLQK